MTWGDFLTVEIWSRSSSSLANTKPSSGCIPSRCQPALARRGQLPLQHGAESEAAPDPQTEQGAVRRGEPHAPTLHKGTDLVIPLPHSSGPCTAAIAAASTTLTQKCPWAIQNPFCCSWREQGDALGGSCGVPWAHHARGVVNTAGKQIAMPPWLCGRFDSPKSHRCPGMEAGGCGAGLTLPSQSSVPRPGSLSPRRAAAAAGRAAEANFAEWLFFKNNFAFVSRSGLLQIE